MMLTSKLPRATTAFKSTARLTAARAFSSSHNDGPRKHLVTGEEGVHQNMKISKSWRNKPLFRRQGDVRFKTGTEAAQLLVNEAMRRDAHEKEFIDSVTSNLHCLSPIFDRNPKYAFVAKTLIEPERFVQFRVAWIDDTGVVRMNRGYRIQYSSSLGPYEGTLHFGSHITNGVIKALGFDTVFSNALTGFDMGAAVGGADFNPLDKSEAEMQRFCQSYMTELAKYVGPDQDFPWMGMGVGQEEMGYLFGQYKRINVKAAAGGRYFLSGDFPEVRHLLSCSENSGYRSSLTLSKFIIHQRRPLDMALSILPTKCCKTRVIPWKASAALSLVVARWLGRWRKSCCSLGPFPCPFRMPVDTSTSPMVLPQVP